MSAGVSRRLAPSFLPATAVLEMTYRCNHACVFCSCPWYAEHGEFDCREEMPLERWKTAVSDLVRQGVVNFAFTGGEPLLKDGIEELILFAAAQAAEHIETVDGSLVSRNAPPGLFLLSNGKSMRSDILDLCARLDVNLSMSLPGLATFPEHTCAGVDSQHVLDWFRRAKDAGVKTTVGVTVTRRNIHELYETIAEALLAGADTLLMNRFMPGGRGLTDADDLLLTAEQIVEMLDIAEEVLRAGNRKGSVGTELPLCVVDPTRYENLVVGTRCSAAREFFVIGPSGHVRVCNHSPVRLAHIDDIDSLRRDSYWRTFTQKDYLPSVCGDCSDRGACDGGCREAAHIAGGSVDSPDPLSRPDLRDRPAGAASRAVSGARGRPEASASR